MKAAPTSSFIMAEAELLLELLVVPLDPPAQLGKSNEALERGIGGKVGKPELGRLDLAFGPLDQEPEFGPGRRAIVVPVSWADPDSSEA